MHELHQRIQRTADRNNAEASVVTSKSKQRENLGNETVLIALVVYNILIILFADHLLRDPSELPKLASLAESDFNFQNARRHLTNITNLGPRPVGSDANELYAPQYIIGELERIKSGFLNADKFTMEIDLQRVKGGTYRRLAVHKAHEVVSVYHDIQNIAVRILPKQRTAEAALLVNSHHDSVPGSAGAGDDASSCALMIELARAIVSGKHELLNGVVLLWNGAEETPLQASHAFVTQHDWFHGPPRVAGFVNLDAAGSSGREVAFQIGPENPWLMEAYANTVENAWASVAAQEIFESGLIPSGTDFQQFRDYGRIPGIDLAFVQNGYVYHTKFDTADRISDGALHRAGCNLLALVRRIANSSLLAEPGASRHGHVVFFDVLGALVVVYPKSVATVTNLLVCALVLLVAIRPKLSRTIVGGAKRSDDKPVTVTVTYGSQLVTMTLLVTFNLLVTFLSVLLVAFAGSRFYRNQMGWYSQTWPSLVYPLVATLVQLDIIKLSRRFLFANINSVQLEELHFDAFQLLLTILLASTTFLQIGSAYLLMLWTLNAFLVRSIVYERLLGGNSHDSPFRNLLLTVCSYSLVTVQHVYLAKTVLQVFVPIFGRSGSEVNTEVMYASILSGLLCLPMLSQVGLLYRVRFRFASTFLAALFLAVLATLCCSNLAFPYSNTANNQSVFPRRLSVSHLTRVVHQNDSVSENRTYLWIHTWDPSDEKLLNVNFLGQQVDLSQHEPVYCNLVHLPYCGLPVYYAFGLKIRRHHLIPLPDSAYPVRPKPELNSVGTTEVASNNELFRNVRASFQLQNTPSYTNLFVATRLGVQFKRWTVHIVGGSAVTYENLQPAYSLAAEEDGQSYLRNHYMLTSLRGSNWTKEALQIDLDFAVASFRVGNVPLAELAFGSLYIIPPLRDTPVLTTVIDNLPDWVSPLYWNSHYEVRTIRAVL